MEINLSEHTTFEILLCQEEDNTLKEEYKAFFIGKHFNKLKSLNPKRLKDRPVFEISSKKGTNDKEVESIVISAGYFIGLDWLVEGKHHIRIEPKLNRKLTQYYDRATDQEDIDILAEDFDEYEGEHDEDESSNNIKEIDFLKMLLDIMTIDETTKNASHLFRICWDKPWIKIRQKEDQLTPFLVIQYLQLLKVIVQKGLRKSYYKVQKNMRNRIKGKILVGAHIKQNIFKNRFTYTLCEYQEFGIDNQENRFLKKAFLFCSAYIQNNEAVFKQNKTEVHKILNYCRPAFEYVNDELRDIKRIQFHYNPFFKEYHEAFKIGNYILRSMSYNISNAVNTEVELPPFWIDMPMLFELYFYYQLIKANPKDKSNIKYQFATYGNALDFLITKPDYRMIIDAKYKPAYNTGQIHEDIRQVSGYARLKKVREKLGVTGNPDQIIKCLIIYPDLTEVSESPNVEFSKLKKTEIKAYHKVYKLGIRLPYVE